MPSQCLGKTKRGAPCSAQVWRDGLCRWHHPALEAQRAEERRRGGAARSNKARARKQLPAEILSDDELLAWLGVAFKAVLAGKMLPGVGNAAATIAKAMVAVKQASELEDRLAAIEAKVGLRQSG
jgi:hypothetical protein